MGDSSELDCPHCDKKYKNKGWLSGHISDKHGDMLLLEQDMTTMRLLSNHDLNKSFQEAGQNLSENPLWDDPEDMAPSGPTSTPKAPPPVPLCANVNNYVIEKGKTLPASFLATLLPPPGFLEDLNRSLHKEDQVTNLLERFEQEIRCLKCNICELTCLGSENLRSHMEKNHRQGSQPSRPDPALPSFGEYLASLEPKIDKCTDYIKKQSIMIEKLLALNEAKLVEKGDDVIKFFKCGRCSFETEDRSILNNHMNQEHQDTHSWEVPFKCNQCAKEYNSKEKFNRHISKNVMCPICSSSHCSELIVTKHVEEQHPEIYTCHVCRSKFTSQTELDNHVCDVHSVNSNEVKCPLCSYTNSLESVVTNHVQEQHPEVLSCSHCQSKFNSKTELESHVLGAHQAR